MSSFVFCWRKPLVYSPGKLQYSSNSTINKSSVNRSKTLLSMFINRESRRDPELTFLPSFCERSANEMPTFRSTSQKGIRAKRAKENSLQYSGNQTLFCAKNTAEYVFIYELKCFKSIFTEFINFHFNGKWRRHSPFANRKPSDTER